MLGTEWGPVTSPPSATAGPPLQSGTGVINAQKDSALCFKIFSFSSLQIFAKRSSEL